MKKIFSLLVCAFLISGLVTASAQFAPRGSGARGPTFAGAFSKLFGQNQAFSADLTFQSADPDGNTITMPGKINFDAGKSRFEFNMSTMQGTKMPPNAAAQMKAMGLDQMISLSRPDKKMGYVVYPGMKSYVAKELSDDASTNLDNVKINTTKIGTDTIDGHDCVKNQVTVTDANGETNQFTVWNATDLKNFPVKIVNAPSGENKTTMVFKDVSFAKPAADLFEVPADYTKYSDPKTLMQTEMMKKMGAGGGGFPRAQ